MFYLIHINELQGSGYSIYIVIVIRQIVIIAKSKSVSFYHVDLVFMLRLELIYFYCPWQIPHLL